VLHQDTVVWAGDLPWGIDYWYPDGGHEFRFSCGACGMSARPAETQLASEIASGATEIDIRTLAE
jgi:hypothetical protein